MGGAAALLGIAILVYAVRFPVVSNRTDDWADFGSYLAGVSALIIGFATVLLLLHNVRLLREQVDIGHRHTSMQDQLIREQRDALQRQERAAESGEAERAVDRVLQAIRGVESMASVEWTSLSQNVAQEALRFGDHDRAFRHVWNLQGGYPSLQKLRGLLLELQQRFREAQEREIASRYWPAWIAGELQDTAIRVLYYEARLDPDGEMARWVRDNALMRYATAGILLRQEDAMDDLPIPAPVH